MRRTAAPVLLAALCALLLSPLAAAQGQRREKRPRARAVAASIIGYIKNEDLVDLCGCGFEHTTSSRGYTFSSDPGGETAWMNLDGEDVKLARTHVTGPKRARVGSRYVERYEAAGVKVTLVEVVDRLCVPYGPGCETIGFDATITVTKGARRQTVKAKGQCGCV